MHWKRWSGPRARSDRNFGRILADVAHEPDRTIRVVWTMKYRPRHTPAARYQLFRLSFDLHFLSQSCSILCH